VPSACSSAAAIGRWIDLCQHLPGADIAAFLKIHTNELAADLGEDRVAGPRLGRPERGKLDRKILRNRLRGADRDRARRSRSGRFAVENEPQHPQDGNACKKAKNQAPPALLVGHSLPAF
jgi:hypothetical protein